MRSSRIGGCPAIQARIISTRSAGGDGGGAEARKRLSMSGELVAALAGALDVLEHRRLLAAGEAARELVEELQHEVSSPSRNASLSLAWPWCSRW